jgi:hypothetical protein
LLYEISDLGPNSIRVEYIFTNYGKTPAFIQSIDARFDFLTTAPDNSQHLPTRILSGEIILKTGESSIDVFTEHFDRPFETAARQAFEDRSAYLTIAEESLALLHGLAQVAGKR